MTRVIFWGITLGMLSMCAFVCNPAMGQETTASIIGTVVDVGGAVINDATVTVTDTERGTVYTTKTKDGGIFTFARLSF